MLKKPYCRHGRTLIAELMEHGYSTHRIAKQIGGDDALIERMWTQTAVHADQPYYQPLLDLHGQVTQPKPGGLQIAGWQTW